MSELGDSLFARLMEDPDTKLLPETELGLQFAAPAMEADLLDTDGCPAGAAGAAGAAGGGGPGQEAPDLALAICTEDSLLARARRLETWARAFPERGAAPAAGLASGRASELAADLADIPGAASERAADGGARSGPQFGPQFELTDAGLETLRKICVLAAGCGGRGSRRRKRLLRQAASRIWRGLAARESACLPGWLAGIDPGAGRGRLANFPRLALSLIAELERMRSLNRALAGSLEGKGLDAAAPGS